LNTDIRKKLDILDLMPLGKKETLPVKQTKSVIPAFKKLCKVNYKLLYNEFLSYDKEIKYIADRFESFTENDIDVDEYKAYMESLGFNKDTYIVYPLRDKFGKYLFNEDSNTAQFFDAWPTMIFRPQYNYTVNDWHAKNHIDHTDSSTHGYRVLIPLNKNFDMTVENITYKLELGYAYFIDVTRKHSAWAQKDRVALSFQMADDTLL